jgi:murein L,D-transpeptidase YafK
MKPTCATFAALAVVVAATCSRPALASGSCTAKDSRVVVETAKHRLALCEGGWQVAEFGVRLGRGGVGKTAEGDGKTPLGTYPLGEPRPSQRFGVFIPIGYPTAEQRSKGYTGGDVGVHGPHRWVRWLGSLVNTFDSSDGCVGLATDDEINRLAAWMKQTHVRTIEIR